jgi:hypothetical protein
MKTPRYAVIPMLTVLASTDAFAMNSADFLDKMNGYQRAIYVSGLVDLEAYSLGTAGGGDKAARILDWYFRGPGPKQVVAAARAHRDLPVEGILKALSGRLCKQSAAQFLPVSP